MFRQYTTAFPLVSIPSFGDCINILWSTENGNTKKNNWVSGVFISCDDCTMRVFYLKNSLSFITNEKHDNIFVYHDLKNIEWTWANPQDDWEYKTLKSLHDDRPKVHIFL